MRSVPDLHILRFDTVFAKNGHILLRYSAEVSSSVRSCIVERKEVRGGRKRDSDAVIMLMWLCSVDCRAVSAARTTMQVMAEF